MSLDADVQARLEQSLGDTDAWFAIHSRFSESVPAGDEERHRALVWAFAYNLLQPTDVEGREREGSPFGAFLEFDGGRMPPRLGDVPDEDVAVWGAAYDAVQDPRLRSRIGDLLWERRAQPRPDLRARGACEALLALSSDASWGPMESTEGLVRALELARAVSDDELEQRVIEHMVATVHAELDRGDDRPGISYTLLRALVDLPAKRRPSELRELLDRTAQVYGDDPHQFESVVDLLAAITSADELPALRLRQAERWRQSARDAEGITRAAFLERALDVARTHGLAELARELRVELDQMTEDELDLKMVSSELRVSTEKVEQLVQWFLSFDSWQESLTAFGVHGPPGGEPDEADREVERRRQAHPLSFLITRTLVDPDSGAPIFHATDEASHRLAALAQHRLFAARIWSLFAPEILQRFTARYGRPAAEELTEFFTSELIDSDAAERIARAFELWWDGAYDDSAHVLAPRLEGAVRTLARLLGIVVIREPVADKPGGLRSLGDLFFAVEGQLPAGWRVYLYHLLSDPLGLNLRNVIAHGVRSRVDSQDAALLLHAACFVRLIQVSKPPTAEVA